MAGANVVSKPEVNFVLTSAEAAVTNAPQKILLVGQVDGGGLTTATPTAGSATGELVQNIGNAGEENQLFGERSHLAAMVRAVKKITTRVQVDAIAIDDAVGTARTVTCTITGTATEGGTLTVIAGSEKESSIDVAIDSGNDPTAVADAITAAVVAAPQALYYCENTAGALTFTAINSGTVANGTPLAIDGTVAGVTVGSVAEGAAGATDPTTTTTLDVINDNRYQGIVWPYSGAADDLGALLDPRFNANNAILDGVGFIGVTDTFANIEDAAGLLGGADYNSQSVVVIACKLEDDARYVGPSIAEPDFVQAAQVAAVRALRLTTGEVISRYLTSTGARDQFGGPALASLPYFNTKFPNLPAPRAGLGWTQDEIGFLLGDGAGVIGQDSSGSTVLAGEIPTTYLTNGGNSDPTWHYLNYVDTASQAREYFHNNVKKRFAQSRLTEGETPAGRDIANAGKIKAYLVELYATLAGIDYVLVQDGQKEIDFFKRKIKITTDLLTGTVTITMLLPIVTQLRKINATVTIAFDTNG